MAESLRELRDRREDDHWEMERLKLEAPRGQTAECGAEHWLVQVVELYDQLSASRRSVDEAAELHQEVRCCVVLVWRVSA